MMETPPFEFGYSQIDRERFRSGELARGWAARFPQLFSEADLRVALAAGAALSRPDRRAMRVRVPVHQGTVPPRPRREVRVVVGTTG